MKAEGIRLGRRNIEAVLDLARVDHLIAPVTELPPAIADEPLALDDAGGRPASSFARIKVPGLNRSAIGSSGRVGSPGHAFHDRRHHDRRALPSPEIPLDRQHRAGQACSGHGEPRKGHDRLRSLPRDYRLATELNDPRIRLGHRGADSSPAVYRRRCASRATSG